MMPREQSMPTAYVVTLRPEPSDVPGEIRLRRLLKAALRVYGLRCVAITPAAACDAGGPQHAGPTSGPSDTPGRVSGPLVDRADQEKR